LTLWTANSTQIPPSWEHGPASEKVYATYKGWVKKHKNGKEEVLVAIANLDTRCGAAIVQDVNFANANNASYTAQSIAQVEINFTQTINIYEALTYTGISGNSAFTVGETVYQGNSTVNTGIVISQNTSVVVIAVGGTPAVGDFGFSTTSNTLTQITGLTSNATANVTVVNAPVVNVSVLTGNTLSTNVVASFSYANSNDLFFNFTVPQAESLTYTGLTGNSSFTVAELVKQSNGAVVGTVVTQNSTVVTLASITGGPFVVTSNTFTQITGATSHAIANVAANGVAVLPQVLSIVGQTLTQNTIVNIVGNNTINATASFTANNVAPLGGVVGGVTTVSL